jgi:membrane protein implicated in regulation of membrane protease activity
MDPELKNILVTGAFVLVMLVLFIWLIRALLPSAKEDARQASRDEYETAGYETMDTVRRKEFAAMGAGVFAILLILTMIGGLGYLLWTADFSSLANDQAGLDTIMVFVPALVLLVMIIAASSRYIKHQQVVLHEYRVFKSKRQKAIDEYEAKRSGKDQEGKQPAKKKTQQVKPKRGGTYGGTHKKKRKH